jgi:hypothetical protein
MWHLLSSPITTADYSAFYNLAPAGLYRVCGANFRRLRYRYTAGYAHLAPCGAKKIFRYKKSNFQPCKVLSVCLFSSDFDFS